MALSKIQAESMNLADTYAFTGTVSGAGDWTKTAQTTTSGAATYTFSSIPSTMTEFIVYGNDVSRGTSSSSLVIQLGDSGGLENSGYSYNLFYTAGNGNSVYQNNVGERSGLDVAIYDHVCNFVCQGWHLTGNKWMLRSQMHTPTGSAYFIYCLCEKELSGTLDRIALIDRSGTNMDGGTVQLWYK